jgi:hypothetical protein
MLLVSPCAALVVLLSLGLKPAAADVRMQDYFNITSLQMTLLKGRADGTSDHEVSIAGWRRGLGFGVQLLAFRHGRRQV